MASKRRLNADEGKRLNRVGQAATILWDDNEWYHATVTKEVESGLRVLFTEDKARCLVEHDHVNDPARFRWLNDEEGMDEDEDDDKEEEEEEQPRQGRTTGRKRVSRVLQIDGHQVLRENNYGEFTREFW